MPIHAFGLRPALRKEIIGLAKRHDLSKVLLFGSRARGDYKTRSDIDLAISGGKTAAFSLEAQEDTATLLSFDIVNLDGPVQDELRAAIQKEGVLLYEKS